MEQTGVDGLGGAWDAVVVGAGPAGSLAAGLLARRGRSVLLVDKAELAAALPLLLERFFPDRRSASYSAAA